MWRTRRRPCRQAHGELSVRIAIARCKRSLLLIQRIARVACWLLVGAIFFVTFAPVRFRPQTGHAYLERSGAFFLLGATLLLSYPKRGLMMAAVVLAIAVGSEGLQAFIPTRDARPADAAEKALGGLAGVAVMAALGRGWGVVRQA